MNSSSSSLAAVGESLRAIAHVLEAEAAAAPAAAPAAPEPDYSELNYKTLKDAAKAIGVSVDRLYQLVNKEGFPGYKIGERWYIPKVELAEWNAKAAKEKVRF